MLPTGSSSGGLDALRGRSTSVDPIVSLTNSVAVLTTSVDKLNDAVVDMVDVGEDATDQPSASGRRTKRRRQSQINYKRDHDSSWLRIRTPEEKALEKKFQDMDNRSQRRVQFSSFDSAKNQEEMIAVVNIVKSSFDGMKSIFDRLISPLETFVSNNKRTAAAIGSATGLAIIAAGAAAAVGNAVGNAGRAIGTGIERGRAGREALDAQPPRNQSPGINVNPGRPGSLTPEQQEENRRAIEENRPITPEERARFNNPANFTTVRDAEPVDTDEFIDKLAQRLEGGSKDDATPELHPYYNRDNLDPREFETPAFAPIVAAPGTGMGAAGGAGAGGIIGTAPGAGQGRRDDPAGALREVHRLLDGLAGILNPSYGAMRRLEQAEEARRAAAASEEWNRAAAERMARTAQAPGPAIPEVSTAPIPAAPDSVPIPQTPTNVPRVGAPDSVPVPQAPTNVPSIATPSTDPVVVRPPISVPTPARPAAVPAVQQPAIAQAPATTAPPQPAIPPPPPAPPPAPPLQPARPAPVVVMQAPQPPPYIPPTINQPRATGSGNIGRGVGFSPPPPSPMSPTTRTPSYPARSF